jgi:hypothetical protein
MTVSVIIHFLRMALSMMVQLLYQIYGNYILNSLTSFGADTMGLRRIIMPAENESIKCLRCNSAMESSQDVYVLPKGRSSNLDEIKVDLTKVISLQLLRCSSPECDFIELKAPKRWPSLTLGGQ